MRSDWFIIGISGATCSGKTTLANRLLKTVAPSYVFNQDKYFYPDDSPKHVWLDDLKHNDYDILSSLDMEAMYDDIKQTISGDEDKSLERNTQVNDDNLQLPGKKVLIIEGFTALNYGPIYDLCDLRYYLVLEYGECFSRRSLRLYDPPDVPGYFERVAWPRHLHYRDSLLRTRRQTDIRVLDGAGPALFHTVLQHLAHCGFHSKHL